MTIYYICFIYAILSPPRPSVLSIFALILEFKKELSRHDSNEECILFVDMQHSQQPMTLYLDELFNWGGNSERNVE